MRLRQRGPWLWGLLLAAACVSRSLPEARFDESRNLTQKAFNIAVADPDRFTFAAVGDLHIRGGDTSRLERILDGATAGGDAFVALLGDIVDQGDRSDVEAVWGVIRAKGWEGRVLPVLGNHDVFHEGWAAYRELSGPSHYRLDVGNTTLLVLDTADGTLGREQMEWAEGELRGAAGPKVILTHYLPVVPGVRTYLRLSDETEALRARALAHRFGVSAWLGGHYHSYVTGQVDGVLYVVAGGGGGRRMPPVDSFFYARLTVDGSSVSSSMVVVP